jgi:hypothetical protein
VGAKDNERKGETDGGREVGGGGDDRWTDGWMRPQNRTHLSSDDSSPTVVTANPPAIGSVDGETNPPVLPLLTVGNV